VGGAHFLVGALELGGGAPTQTVPTRRPLAPMRGVPLASTDTGCPAWSRRLSSMTSPERGTRPRSMVDRARATLSSSASHWLNGVPRNCSSLRPSSSHRAALACSIRPPWSQTTSTSDMAVSTLKMNCWLCSSSAFFCSSSTSSSIRRV
jgi:hypothetical protein